MTNDQATLSSEEIDHVVAVIDVCLEEGYDIEGVDRSVLRSAREKLRPLE